MHSHPAVAEAALIPVPDPKWGEVGRATIVLKPGLSLTAAELIAWLRERMANYKAPRGVPYEEQQLAALSFEKAGILKIV